MSVSVEMTFIVVWGPLGCWFYGSTRAETFNISILVSSLSLVVSPCWHSRQLILSQISHVSYRTRPDQSDTKLWAGSTTEGREQPSSATVNLHLKLRHRWSRPSVCAFVLHHFSISMSVEYLFHPVVGDLTVLFLFVAFCFSDLTDSSSFQRARFWVKELQNYEEVKENFSQSFTNTVQGSEQAFDASRHIFFLK